MLGWKQKRKTLKLAIAGLLLGTSLSALSAYAEPNPVLTSTSYFTSDGRQETQDLILRTLDIQVKVEGGFAETTAIAEFYNPSSNTLEGNFTFDMPEGSTLIGYALDINGELRDGVIVEKLQAERAFNDRIRRGIDPGLAEVTRSNAFTTRVFPIFSRETRRISVTFITPVSESDPYELPIESGITPEGVSISVEGDVSVQGLGPDGAMSAQSLPESGMLVIRPTTVPRSTVTRHSNGRMFLNVTLPSDTTVTPFAPESVRVYWDTSLSHAPHAVKSRDFLTNLIQTRRPLSLEVVPFARGVTDAGHIDIRPEPDELGDVIDEFVYDGATNLEDLFAEEHARSEVDVCILVTDGRLTLGDFPDTRLPCKLHVISASPEADDGVLALLAKAGRGQYIDLNRISAETAMDRLTQAVIAPIRLLVDGENVLDEAEWQDDGDSFRLFAPLRAGAQTFRLDLPGRTFDGSVPASRPARHDAAGASWAKLRLTSERARGATRDDLVALSRNYSVVSDETSLLVLETIWDYVQNELPLPDDGFTKEERESYAEGLEAQQTERERDQEYRLEFVSGLWDQQVEWYGRAFDGEAGPRGPVAGSRDMATGTSEFESEPTGSDLVPPPPPPPPPLPSPPPEPMMENAMRQEHVVVTGSVVAEHTEAPVVSNAFRSETGDAALPVDIISEEELRDQLSANADASDADQGISVTMDIRPWSPDRPYLEAVEGLCEADLHKAYLEQRQEFGTIAGFYFEIADVFSACGENEKAVAITLSALELPDADHDTLTAVGKRLTRFGDIDTAIDVFRRVTEIDPTRPQPWRDLALAIDESADQESLSQADRRARLSEALDLFNHVIANPWDSAFEGIESISVTEANRVLTRLEAAGGQGSLPLETLRAEMPMDLRIVVSWNVDETDMDLWVVEPTGERARYDNTLTAIGGRFSNDMTNGYGPEEYLLKDAPEGLYDIIMDYYSGDIVNPSAAVAIQAEIWQNYGQPGETMRRVDLAFTNEDQEEYLVGTVTVRKDD